MEKRQLTKLELEVFYYLNDLRASNQTNMFGVTPYIQNEFGLNRAQSIKILLLWMNNFHEDKEAYKCLLIY